MIHRVLIAALVLVMDSVEATIAAAAAADFDEPRKSIIGAHCGLGGSHSPHQPNFPRWLSYFFR